jgi:hypothetical protein
MTLNGELAHNRDIRRAKNQAGAYQDLLNYSMSPGLCQHVDTRCAQLQQIEPSIKKEPLKYNKLGANETTRPETPQEPCKDCGLVCHGHSSTGENAGNGVSNSRLIERSRRSRWTRTRCNAAWATSLTPVTRPRRCPSRLTPRIDQAASWELPLRELSRKSARDAREPSASIRPRPIA